MKFLNLTYKNKEIVFFSVLFSILLIKFFCISPLSQDKFFTNYKYFMSDSFDWIANGIFLFNSKEITFRNPGLPLIIKALYGLNILFLLPLFNYVVLIFILINIFQITKFLTKNTSISLIACLFIFLNYSVQDYSNWILADYYAICFYTISLKYLLSNKFSRSFLYLGISSIFQNFAFFLVPVWFIYIFVLKIDIKNLLLSQISMIKTYLRYFILFFVFPGIWFAYKLYLFGNPFYTGVIQFDLFKPNLNLLFFYIITCITMFGPILFLIRKIFRKSNNLNVIFMFFSLLYTFSFWSFFYYWADRRFMLYCIPFFYPLIFYVFYKNCNKKYHLISFFYLLLVLYPTTISIGNGFTQNIVPITNWHKLKFNTHFETKYNTININFPVDFVIEKYEKKNILFPGFFEIFYNKNYLLNNDNTLYNRYISYLNDFFIENKCLNYDDLSMYQLKSITMIYTKHPFDKNNYINCNK